MLGLVLVLSHSEQRTAGTNAVWPTRNWGGDLTGRLLCQRGELVPAGTAALRLPLTAATTPGPEAVVTLRRQGRVLDRATAVTEAGSLFVEVPIARTAVDQEGVEVCVRFGIGAPVVAISGPRLAGMSGMRVGETHLRRTALPITYLRAGGESWWQYASTVVARMGLGRGDWGGRWQVGLLAALLLGSLALVIAIVQRSLVAQRPEEPDRARRGGPLGALPPLAWAVAAVAVLNAAAWSIITPAFQVPDEPTHVAYAQLIAERGRPPAPRTEREVLAPELQTAMDDLRFTQLTPPGVWSQLQQQRLDRDLHAGLPRHAGNQAGPAAPEPPTYYALEAIPYRVASGATLLDRLALMRLLSALMAGVTALFSYLFVRECLPGRPWAWTVGALGVALTPLLGFVSGGVNPDALLFPVCAALFYLLARAFRRGLTTRLAIAIGGVLALGLVGKINFYGLAPGAVLGAVLAARATTRGWNRRTARLVAIVAGLALAPYLLLSVLDALLWDRLFVLARTPAEAPESHGGFGGQFSYLWQVFLPRLPGQSTAFPEFAPPYELWVKGFIGKFGWVRVQYADWAYRVAAILLGAAGLLAASVLVRRGATLRRRWREAVAYAGMTAGLLLLIGLVALRGWAPGIEGAVQGRYLLPLLPLFGALLVLAARGAGARWGRAVGVAIVLLGVAWSLFGQLLTIAWYYG
ncbi:MAG TPA: DUF2142 domain-containing protein [Conexibacter sp.]|nr:DUF2142 domain-containing protein [Conexibacter sp.]